MNLLALVTFVCLGTLVASQRSCPEDADFNFYCWCQEEEFSFRDPELIVGCHGLHEGDIADILSKLKGKQLKYLKLEQIKIKSFKKEYVQNLHIRQLIVDNAPLTSVEDGALGAIEGLNLVYFLKTRLQKIPDQTNATLLQELSLDIHNVVAIGPEDFPKDSKLDTLTISTGHLETVKDGAFLSLKYLQYLSLDDNFISTLPKLLTSKNSNVSEINLALNHLEEIPAGIFQNEKHLQILNLEDNQIENVTAVPFKQLLQRGTTLYLGENFIGCDKSLCWLADYLKTTEKYDLVHGNCSSRTGPTKLWQLDSKELGC